VILRPSIDASYKGDVSLYRTCFEYFVLHKKREKFMHFKLFGTVCSNAESISN